MQKLHILHLYALLMLILTVLSLSSCKAHDDFLSWNEPPLSFIGEYEENGVLFTARFTADGERLTAVILSPEAAADVTYTLANGVVTVSYGGVTERIETLPAPLTRFLLLYPENAVLSRVTQEADARLVYVVADGGSYCYRFDGDGLPTHVTAETAHGFYSLTIRKK